MLKAFRASILVLILACSAFAGEIHNPLAPPAPPPETGNSVQDDSANDEIPNPQLNEISEITLNILTSVISLL